METNELVKSKESLMTIKDVAGILGLDPRTVQLKVKEIFPENVSNGKTTYLTESQVTKVKLDLENRFEVKTNLEKKLLIQQAMNFLNEEVEELKQENSLLQLENNTLQIELDKEKSWYSVKRIKNMGFIKDVPARKAWSPLKKWSINNGYQVKTIFDANYGDVKTYHKDSWIAVYDIDFKEIK